MDIALAANQKQNLFPVPRGFGITTNALNAGQSRAKEH
jgi:hypothetical protein